jgi:crotonobetainyl-CoA:carnitine CoA-transferase CaiB-like acyl-CoA transferase
MPTPSSGPRVADFSTHFSGPVCSRQMVQLGADVLKVEHPVHGDGNRGFPPMFENQGLHHLHLNAGTRSIAVSPGTPEWNEAVPAIARWADVVIVGNRPSTATRLGIDFASLQKINPQLVYCLISGYGIEGEWSGLPAHGLNMDALAGTVQLDWQDGVPRVQHAYRSVGTTLAGVQAALGIYAALDRRSRGGGGQVVHVSIWESAMSWMWRDLATFANTGKPWTAYQDLGSRYAVYAAADGQALLVCPIERRFWEKFCDVVGLPADLKVRGDWSEGTDAGAAYAALGERELIQSRMSTLPGKDWLERLAAADIPVAPVLDWRQAMDSPHAAANGVMARYELDGHEVRVPTTPVSITPAGEAADGGYAGLGQSHRQKHTLVRPPPALGEHNASVAQELGIRLPEYPNQRGDKS